ncbi:MAG: Uma2 family endonuclease [Selenomonadaceae bacterium]|nr:Uma2 family endonuclease [Selenomonadaceae bacterium]
MGAALAYQYEYGAYEFINGEEYMMARPSYEHMRIEGNIFGMFDRYLRGKRCRPAFEVDVYLSDEDHVIPDVVIVCNPDIINKKRIEGAPDLVVEILSRSTGKKDRTVKLMTYAKYGVKEYWIVDPANKSVEVYLLKDGAYDLDNIYYFYTEEEWEDMDDEERALAESQKTIKVSLYDDFMIDVGDVFYDVD